MCLLSLENRPEETFSVFQQGLDSGLWWYEELFADPDLNAVRDLTEFKRLTAISQERYNEARKQIAREYTILEPAPPASGLYPLLMTLHGRNGNKDIDLGQWELARQCGWLILSCQSTQPVFEGAYHWDNPAIGLDDLSYYYERIAQKYSLDSQRMIMAGFSQGSGMSIYTALKGPIPARGFIGIGTWWADPDELTGERSNVRGYFITGEKDHTLDRAREIQKVLRNNNVEFAEEIHAELGHEFSRDFGASFDKAIEFIFMEKE
jgi:pimeloyl-ACP methyl ester carboxylesterase